jgi:hypothetical protein
MADGYQTAAVCLNGHTATSAIEYHSDDPGKFCGDCGAKIISNCPSCSAKIRGDYYVQGVFGVADVYTPSAYCYQCGNPFPWTAEKLKAAKEIADELEGLNDEERTKLKAALDDVTRDSPRNEITASRIKKLLGHAGGELAEGLWKMTIEVASESMKKLLTTGHSPF